MLGEKTICESHNDAMCCSGQIKGAASHKTSYMATYIPSHKPSK